MRGTLLPAMLTGVLLATAAAADASIRVDRGSDRPPGVLATDSKSIWMTEWTACWRVSMARMSKILHIPVRSGTTPQQAAKKLAKRAVFLLYETEPELVAAADGCRNGILWRYYHPPS
jgi:hypothetical protein